MKAWDSKTVWSLEFLCWVNRCLFPGDFEQELLELGASPFAAFTLMQKAKMMSNIVDLYQEFGLHDEEEFGPLLIKYLDMMHTEWQSHKK